MVLPGGIYPHRQRYVDLQEDFSCSAEEARAQVQERLVTLRSPWGLKQVEACLCCVRVGLCDEEMRILLVNFKKDKVPRRERRRR